MTVSPPYAVSLEYKTGLCFEGAVIYLI
jgi:hypothetical protein